MIIAVPLKMEEADFCAVQHHNSFFKTQRSFSLHQQLLYSLFLTSGGFSYCHCGFAVQEKIVGGISAGKKLTPFHVIMRKLVQLANASQADSWAFDSSFLKALVVVLKAAMVFTHLWIWFFAVRIELISTFLPNSESAHVSFLLRICVVFYSQSGVGVQEVLKLLHPGLSLSLSQGTG